MHMCKCANLTFETIQNYKKIFLYTFYYNLIIIFIGQHNKKIYRSKHTKSLLKLCFLNFGQEYAKIIIV